MSKKTRTEKSPKSIVEYRERGIAMGEKIKMVNNTIIPHDPARYASSGIQRKYWKKIGG